MIKKKVFSFLLKMAMLAESLLLSRMMFQSFGAACSKEKKKKNDAYRVLRIHIMIELLMCFHKLVAQMKLVT